eukprot:4952697-Prymnesium_polylepis.1
MCRFHCAPVWYYSASHKRTYGRDELADRMRWEVRYAEDADYGDPVADMRAEPAICSAPPVGSRVSSYRPYVR